MATRLALGTFGAVSVSALSTSEPPAMGESPAGVAPAAMRPSVDDLRLEALYMREKNSG